MPSEDDLCISIDLGGTRMRVAIVNRVGVLIAREDTLTLAAQGKEQTLERLTKIITQLLPYTEGRQLVGISASVAGSADPYTAIIHNANNLPGWDGFSLKPMLEEMFGIPVWALNDGTLGAIGEHIYGIGKGLRNLIYVTVSTGIGGGIIIDGKPIIGHRGSAGEIGHMSIDRNGIECKCGNIGCLETLASGTAIANRAIERLEQGQQSILRDIVKGDLSTITAAMVMRTASQFDPFAMALVDQFAKDLAIGLVNLLHIFDPQIIILGGGVSQSYSMYSLALSKAMHTNTMAHLREHINVVPSKLGDDVSLLGAASLAFQRAERGELG